MPTDLRRDCSSVVACMRSPQRWSYSFRMRQLSRLNPHIHQLPADFTGDAVLWRISAKTPPACCVIDIYVIYVVVALQQVHIQRRRICAKSLIKLSKVLHWFLRKLHFSTTNAHNAWHLAKNCTLYFNS